MEKGGRGGQRVVCVRVCLGGFQSPRVCVKERQKRDDCTHANLILFPTYRHAGRDWTSLTDLLDSPHTCPHGSFILCNLSGPEQTLHPRTRFLSPPNIHNGVREPRRCGFLTNFGALQMQTRVCFVIPTCLFLRIDLPACIR